MATFADIILNDGAATPVAHTFKVKMNDNMVSLWEDRSGGVPIGYATVKVQTKDTPNVRKVMLWIAMPTLEAIAGSNSSGFTPAQKVAYTHRSYQEFILPQRGTLAERKNIIAFHVNGLANATIKSVIQDGDEITG